MGIFNKFKKLQSSQSNHTAAMPDSCTFVLRNNSNSSDVYAYITGIAIQHNGARVLMKANGKDLYFPESPKEILQPLKEDCAIPLGPTGNEVSITVPQIAGGRVWITMDGKLTFLLNPGPALVEPSVLNPSDPNAQVNFGFCEFTLNNDQLFANISYVDFVPRIPIALKLENSSGHVQEVQGMPPDGLDRICEGLRQQTQADGRPWDKLVVQQGGQYLRALNATHGGAVGANFDGYYEPHVEEVWKKYSKGCCRVNTQAGPGVLEGRVNNKGELVIGDECFAKPSTADILVCTPSILLMLVSKKASSSPLTHAQPQGMQLRPLHHRPLTDPQCNHPASSSRIRAHHLAV
jgi:hypothetical protein